MKAVTMFRADDGSIHQDESKAAERDAIIKEVATAMRPLGGRPESGPVYDAHRRGDGFIQHDPQIVRVVKRALIHAGRGPLGWWYDGQKKDHGKTLDDLMDAHPSWFGRMLDGVCPPLERAWGRMWTIDDLGREWDQPYRVEHPGSRKDVCLEDRR